MSPRDIPLILAAGGGEQLIVYAVIVTIYVVAALIKKAAKRGNGGDASARPVVKPSAGGSQKAGEQEEKMRKFFEALGLPTEGLPPKPVAPKKQPPPLQTSTAQAVKAKKERAARQSRHAEPPPLHGAPSAVHVPVGTLGGPRAASPAEVYASTKIAAPSVRPLSRSDVSPAAAIAQDLRRSPETLRRAVVINELLGKPLGLR